MGLFKKKKSAESLSWREDIIRTVQRTADTSSQKIDASIVSRVASLTIDETLKAIGKSLDRVKK